jgi:hypothetical protein
MACLLDFRTCRHRPVNRPLIRISSWTRAATLFLLLLAPTTRR